MKTLLRFCITIWLIVTCTACTTQTTSSKQDPFESFNRPMYKFNKAFDTVLLKPVATIYNGVLPWPIRTGVSNAFDNAGEIPTLVNNILQLDPKAAVKTLWRFTVNSVAGLGGIFDVATKLGVERRSQDFGLTLAKLGDTHSPYLVLPFLGPMTLRDAYGKPVDWYTNIFAYIKNVQIRNGLIALKIVAGRANLLDVDNVADEALDEYTFQRNAYLQYRANKINGGIGHTQDILDEPEAGQGH